MLNLTKHVRFAIHVMFLGDILIGIKMKHEKEIEMSCIKKGGSQPRPLNDGINISK